MKLKLGLILGSLLSTVVLSSHTIIIPAGKSPGSENSDTPSVAFRESPKNGQVLPDAGLMQFGDVQGMLEIETLVTHYLSKTPAPRLNLPGTLETAMAFQAQFVQRLSQTEGKIVGYKAALTNPAAQERFQVPHPLRGTLLETMLIYHTPGMIIPANFAARPFSEGDLMVRVKDDRINNAKTPQEALAGLDAVFPFIELPDLVYAEGVPINGPSLAAINVGARLGVIGQPIPLTATPAWEEQLGKIRLEMLDETGAVIATGTSADLLGHPLNVVLWIKESLKAEGKRLQPGDLLSLGTITPLVPVKPHTQIRARYLGLDSQKPIEIWLKFE